MILVGSSGFMQINEILPLKLKDEILTGEVFTLFINRSKKTDQFGEGNTIFIKRIKNNKLLQQMVKRYIDTSKLKDPEPFMICR